ncbi:uncharacterized protein PgNI_09297 [Pyricularia grisea]|uniref:Uncharacterized protein n=1 Tax=Pyricularia grisea TaxID=148305 RepID=A0A6P8ATV1_PYRGI|nr:uncharacterized protein PgNI_09297 [Pyricularia grisea]TLD05550.1 hypothetical protein PgNI_09297 [Pyricularia grisea]
MHLPDPNAQALGPNLSPANSGLLTLPTEILLKITVLLGNSQNMLRLAQVHRDLYHNILHQAWEQDIKITEDCRSLMKNVKLGNIDGVTRAWAITQLNTKRPQWAWPFGQMNPLMVRKLLDLGCNVETSSQAFHHSRDDRWEKPSPLLQLLLFNQGISRLEEHPLGSCSRAWWVDRHVYSRDIALVDEWCREACQLAGVLWEIVQIMVDHGANVNAEANCLGSSYYGCCSPLSIAIISGMPAEVVSLLLCLGAGPIPNPRPATIFDLTTLLVYAGIWDRIDHNKSLTVPVSTTLLKCENPRPEPSGPKWSYFHELLQFIGHMRQVGQFSMADKASLALFIRIIDLEIAIMADDPVDKRLWLRGRDQPQRLTLLGSLVRIMRAHRKPHHLDVAMAYISILVRQKGVDPNGPRNGYDPESPLHFICAMSVKDEHIPTIVLFLKFFLRLPGVDVNRIDRRLFKKTSLHIACNRRNVCRKSLRHC